MAKAAGKKTIFFCQNCGHESAKWMGQCPACREWNTFVEEPAAPKTAGKPSARQRGTTAAAPVRIRDVSMEEHSRSQTGISEFDRVLGGGVIPGSLDRKSVV